MRPFRCLKLAAAVTAFAAGVMFSAGAAPGPMETKPAVKSPEASKPAASDWKGDPYPLATCAVDDAMLGSRGEAIVIDHDGRELRFCSKDCAIKFKADPPAAIKHVDELIIKQQLPDYAMTVCPVSGEKLGGAEMGEPVNLVYKNRLLRFCCKSCVGQFKKAPSEFIAAHEKAVIERRKSDYPLKVCPISGEELSAASKPVDVVLGQTLVRFCCTDCAAEFREDPQPVLKKLSEARSKPTPAAAPASPSGG